jgi:hypothetical protein
MLADGRLTWDKGYVLLDGKILETPLLEKIGAD